jgi:hypothetical protein
MSKALDTAVILIIIAAWILFVNSLNFVMASKMILYMFGLIFLGAWLIYIIKS